jgi:hypothetical protein
MNEDIVPGSEPGFIESIELQMKDIFAQTVVPIYGQDEDGPSLYGTGTLFRIADTHLLVTAWHVAAEGRPTGRRQLFISDGISNTPLVPLKGHVDYSADERVDIAICRLDMDTVRCLPNRRFFSLSDVNASDVPLRPGLFHVCGCPWLWQRKDVAKRKLSPKRIAYGTIQYSGPTDALGDYDPKCHLLLTLFDNGSYRSCDGSPVLLPEEHGRVSIRGLSGGSIWQTFQNGEDVRAWDPRRAKIVAIQTLVYLGKTAKIRGTRWNIVRRLLVKGFPDLEGALRLYGFCT